MLLTECLHLSVRRFLELAHLVIHIATIQLDEVLYLYQGKNMLGKEKLFKFQTLVTFVYLGI